MQFAASYFFSFHTVLTKSEQFTAACRESRVIAAQVKADLQMKNPDLGDDFDVFSYRLVIKAKLLGLGTL